MSSIYIVYLNEHLLIVVLLIIHLFMVAVLPTEAESGRKSKLVRIVTFETIKIKMDTTINSY